MAKFLSIEDENTETFINLDNVLSIKFYEVYNRIDFLYANGQTYTLTASEEQFKAIRDCVKSCM